MNAISEDRDDRRRDAGTLSDSGDLRMTPSQLKALKPELTAGIARPVPDPKPEPTPDALPVVVQLQSRKKRGTV
ncbi:hypothetical protein AB0399_12230 [Streptomyces sp. NPDC088194]|uniref:hypothetical protein n=1 Tax=Streptomyces sp. NPDC088194 TaxID=3154931 RepID=UPI00344C76FE